VIVGVGVAYFAVCALIGWFAARRTKSAEDFNLKCSGPALWKDGECDLDLKSRVAGFEADSKPVPDACK